MVQNIPNTPITPHVWEGQTFVYRASEPPYDPLTDYSPGRLVIAPGMDARVYGVFRNWNMVPDLDMLYVYVPDTGLHTHLTPADLGLTLTVDEAEEAHAEHVSAWRAARP